MENLNAKDIANNPGSYGFKWSPETVKHGDMDLGKVPILVITNPELFREQIPGAEQLMLDALDGSSIRVQSQGKGRNAKWKDHATTEDDIKVLNVETILLGTRAKRSVRTVEVYIGPEDTKFDSREEAAEAWKVFYAEVATA